MRWNTSTCLASAPHLATTSHSTSNADVDVGLPPPSPLKLPVTNEATRSQRPSHRLHPPPRPPGGQTGDYIALLGIDMSWIAALLRAQQVPRDLRDHRPPLRSPWRSP